MIINVEILDDNLRAFLLLRVKDLIKSEINSYKVEKQIKDCINENLRLALKNVVLEQLKDSQNLRDKINAEIVKKLKNQLNAAIKNAEI